MLYKSRKPVKIISLLCVICIILSGLDVSMITGNAAKPRAAENAIEIDTPEKLQKIGNDSSYPLSGDYILTADLDMSGINFTTIGGGRGTRGGDSGNNVFNGTFDGQGYVISNLTINETGAGSDAQIGLFGIISSNTESEPAEVRNIILSGVNIKADMSGSGYLSLGGLAGEINHNAVIDNIAVFNGTISGNPSNNGDVVGVGGLTGEIRYNPSPAPADNGVIISNIYNGADIRSGSSTNSNFVGGIIGRVQYTSCRSVTACVNTGQTAFKGGPGKGISGGTLSANFSNCYYLEGTGDAFTGTSKSENDLKSSTLLTGLDISYWSAGGTYYMIPRQCAESETLSDILLLASLYPTFADGETAAGVTKDFQLPVTVNVAGSTESVTWQSSKPEVISISGSTATVHSVSVNTTCTLTANTSSGKSKNVTVTVISNISLKIDQEYAEVGVPLTASMVNAPADMVCTYQWSVGGSQRSTAAAYTPTESDLEKTITVTATCQGDYSGSYQTSMYFSKLPVFYIDTEGGRGIYDKVNYVTSELKIQGNGIFNSSTTTLYEGGMGIRGRGNTTWGYSKKPYKIKLDTKTNLFGYGSNKHWVLLANYVDESHMRNMLSYNLSGEMGMPHMKSTSVTLILNGEYQGTYQFCEQVRIADSRVDIFDWENYAEDVAKAIYKAEETNGMTKDQRDDLEIQMAERDLNWINTGAVTYQGQTYQISDYISGMPDATGGILLELDSYYDEYSRFTSSLNQPLQFKRPEFIATNSTFFNYTRNYINDFEAAIRSYDYTTITQGNESKSYSQLFDMDSLVQFWMVSELFMNVDAMKKSTFMYKDIDGLFHMGPIWDMDWSSDSLVSSGQGSSSYSEWHTYKFNDGAQSSQWYKNIIKDPYFAVQAYENYHEYRTNMLEMVKAGGIMETYQSYIQESADANAAKWYTYDNNRAFHNQVSRLKNFLTNRINWLDTKFTSPETLLSAFGSYSSGGGISVESSNITEAENGLIIQASVTDSSAVQAAFYVNGERIGTEPAAGGSASIYVPQSKLVKKTDGYNTVQVFGLSSNGSVISANGRNVTDYAYFKAEVSEELTGTVTISGRAWVGSTLRANVSNTNNSGKLSYTWYADDILIADASDAAYTITEAELDKVITVKVTSSTESGVLVSPATARVIQPAEANSHIIINQVYGGGNKKDTPLNYSFIELYNPAETDILLDGYTLNYLSNGDSDGGTGGGVKTLQLSGTIKADTSYLVRCAAETTTSALLVYSLDHYDLSWNQSIDNKKYQLTLYNSTGYVDGVSVDEEALPEEGPALPAGYISKQRSIRRRDFIDTDSNTDDFEIIRYEGITREELELYSPRTQDDGTWREPDDPGPVDPDPVPADPDPKDPDPVPVASVTLDRQTALIGKGRSITLKPTVLPANAANKTVTYTSSNVKTATVTASGIVKGIQKGTAVITAKAGTRTATCRITVAEVTLNVKKINMQVKQRTSLLKIASRYPANDSASKWTSSNTKVATVTKKGVVKARKTGKAVITVTMKSGASASYSLKVMKSPVKTTQLSVKKSSVSLKKKKTYKIKIIRNPLTANDKVTYTSNKKNVAKVSSSGKITALKKGNAVITVKAGKKKAKIKVKVK